MGENRFLGKYKENAMKEILMIMAFFGVWVLLQAYILPKLGIST